MQLEEKVSETKYSPLRGCTGRGVQGHDWEEELPLQLHNGASIHRAESGLSGGWGAAHTDAAGLLSSRIHFSNSQEAIAQLSEVAVDLGLHHNTHPSEITQAISKRLLEEAEDLPKLEVLYNKTYGGFGYSEEFEAYLPVTEESSSHKLLKMPSHLHPYMTAGPEHRINACGYIRPFGTQQAQKSPFAFQVVLSYYANRIDDIRLDMAVLAYSRADSKAVPGATKACGDLPEGLLKSYCLLVKRGRPDQVRTRDRNFQQVFNAIGEDDEKIWGLSIILIRTL